MTRTDLPEAVRASERSTTARIWGFTAALIGGTALCWMLRVHNLGLVPAPLRLAWPLLALGFTLGHFANIQVGFHKQSHAIDLTDVILIPAIVFADARAVIATAAIGTVVRSLSGKRPLIKAALNVSLHAFAVTVALLCYHAVVGDASVLSVRGWLGAIAAVVTAEVLTHVGIHIAIALSGQASRSALGQIAVSLTSMIIADTILGLAAVQLLWAGAGGGVLFIVIATAVGAAYVTHGRLRIRHTTLTQLYSFEQALAGIVETDQVIAAVLNETLTLFNAEVAQLVLPGGAESLCHTLRLGESQPVTTRGPHPVAELLEGEEGVLVAPRRTQDPRLAEALDGTGFRDAMALRLPTDVAATVEVLVVADRLNGDDVTFGPGDAALIETLATPTAMALRSSDLLNQLRAQVAIKEHQASHDALTGLANRTLFSTELDRALAERGAAGLVGIMLIDLDGFKNLNDTLGHEAGDEFLRTVAHHLDDVMGERGTIGRLGGDEFAVVVPDAQDRMEIAAIADDLDNAVRTPVVIADVTIDLRASIGVTIAPLYGEDRFTLLRQADLAMYRAKQHGGGVAIHNDSRDDYIDRPSLVAALREAIHTSGIRLHYQPKVSFATGEIIGVEALLRWTHPRYGAIAPDQFIPVAELSGLIRPLTRWVLATALAQCSAWHYAGVDVNMAVNLSPTQINDPAVATQIRELLDTYHLPPGALTLEITESAALTDQGADHHLVLDSLARLGVRLSIDDFGVGTSSLARVKNLPVSEVKIDKSFITNLASDPTDDVIVASTISLIHQLDLVVVAEGVESQATYDQLCALGCDIAQGFLVSAPLDPEDLTTWYHARAQPELRSPATIIPMLQSLTIPRQWESPPPRALPKRARSDGSSD
ncbi:MAG: signal transduction protein containing a rane domain an and a domain [Acidimicrobiaceae bacterium]|nr:signal transduction protein containing a rane domain an and a domain [Acidimicrobiaceae bacterium]